MLRVGNEPQHHAIRQQARAHPGVARRRCFPEHLAVTQFAVEKIREEASGDFRRDAARLMNVRAHFLCSGVPDYVRRFRCGRCLDHALDVRQQ